jgi:hypothetical protein
MPHGRQHGVRHGRSPSIPGCCAVNGPSALGSGLDDERMLLSAVACCGIVCRNGEAWKT